MSRFGQEIVHDAAGRGSFWARRDFLKAIVTLPFILRVPPPSGPDLKIALLYGSGVIDAVQGARMSAAEAERAAGLLGGSLLLSEQSLPGPSPAASIAAFILAAPAGAIQPLLPALLERSVSLINAVADPKALGSDPRLFHIPAAGCTLWSSTLEPFGAAQLNDRYRAAYGSGMSSQAWAGWLAVKVLWESAARAGSADAEALLRFLQSPRAAFDGHRGRLLRFDSATHVLDVPCLS